MLPSTTGFDRSGPHKCAVGFTSTDREAPAIVPLAFRIANAILYINGVQSQSGGGSMAGYTTIHLHNVTVRTVHYFTRSSGTSFWPDGITYAGDLAVYPDEV